METLAPIFEIANYSMTICLLLEIEWLLEKIRQTQMFGTAISANGRLGFKIWVSIPGYHHLSCLHLLLR